MDRLSLGWVALGLGVPLVASSLALITAQHRARGLFVELERSQQQAKQLDAEGSRLRVELGRLSQPLVVESAARRLGLRPLDGGRTVFLPAQSEPPQAGVR